MAFKQTWWDEHLKTRFEDFTGWVGDFTAESKVAMRKYIASKNYASILDCGCGPATEYFGYKADGYDIYYMGLDSSKFIIEFVKGRGVPILEGHIEEMPHVPSNAYDVAFSRHVLEHLPTFRLALGELIRVGREEAIHVFFIKPGDEREIKYDEAENLYHNRYKKEDIEDFLRSHKKVTEWRWEDINDNECALFVTLHAA
jgi:SAM-dependent methyltransferase